MKHRSFKVRQLETLTEEFFPNVQHGGFTHLMTWRGAHYFRVTSSGKYSIKFSENSTSWRRWLTIRSVMVVSGSNEKFFKTLLYFGTVAFEKVYTRRRNTIFVISRTWNVHYSDTYQLLTDDDLLLCYLLPTSLTPERTVTHIERNFVFSPKDLNVILIFGLQTKKKGRNEGNEFCWPLSSLLSVCIKEVLLCYLLR